MKGEKYVEEQKEMSEGIDKKIIKEEKQRLLVKEVKRDVKYETKTYG